ncbi:MAG: hypothetical protein K0S55_1588 [Clostridia bacterium]|nr:hypothetical protein [Clostridia bacterium]
MDITINVMQIKKALSLLTEHNFEAYIVGGCVRDKLLGMEPKDYDITTNALPDEVINIFKNYHIVETGLQHGTVTVILDNIPIEITTYRIDGAYSDNRRPDNVNFTKNLKNDLARRDFTINALAYNKDCIIDFFDGRDDLEKRIIRCVGIPDERFKEDALRILRALRFSAVLGFDIEDKTAESIHKNKSLLKNIANERISSEFSKLLCGDIKYVEKVLIEYIDVFGIFIPELLPMQNFLQNNEYHIYNVLNHTIKTVINTPENLIYRLTALLHDVGKPSSYTEDNKGVGHFYGHNKKSSEMAKDILKRLKYDSHTVYRVTTLILFHDIPIEADEKIIKKRLNKLSYNILKDLYIIKRADILSQNLKFISRLEELNKIKEMTDKIISEGQCYSLESLAVNGRDLKSLKISEGKQVGIILNYLLNAVINGDLINEKEILLIQAENYYKHFNKNPTYNGDG